MLANVMWSDRKLAENAVSSFNAWRRWILTYTLLHMHRRRGQGKHLPPPPKKKIGKYFSGNCYVKFGNFLFFEQISFRKFIRAFSYFFFGQILSKIRACCYFFIHNFRAKKCSPKVDWASMPMTMKHATRNYNKSPSLQVIKEAFTSSRKLARNPAKLAHHLQTSIACTLHVLSQM